nr:SNF1-related kinase [Cryptomonas curvata]
MQLLFYYNNQFKLKKKTNKSKKKLNLESKKIYQHSFNLHIFGSLNWIMFHSFLNPSLFVKVQLFLEKTITVSNVIKNQKCRLHLIKMRIENSCFDIFIYKNWFLTNFVKYKNLSITINSLQVIPWFKKFSLKNFIINFQTFFNNIYEKILFIFGANFSKNINTLILSTSCSFYSSFQNIETEKITSYISINIENVNLLSESYCSVYGLVYLIISKRKFYSIILLIRFIKACLLKSNYFRSLIIFQEKKRKIQPKIDPTFNNYLRCGGKKIFSFYKLASHDFKVLPSKNHIPLHFCLEIFEITASNKNVYEKMDVLTSRQSYTVSKKNIKNKNLKKLQKKDNFILNQQIYLFLGKPWISKRKFLKKGVHFPLKKKWSIEYMLVKESGDFYNEIFGIIFISQIEKLFQEQYLDLWLSSFYIYSIHSTSGLVNIIFNSISLHELNKARKNEKNVSKYYTITKKGQFKFIESLAGYSLFCFIFQLKDRHNGNILINLDNRLVHVDFGYIMGYLPGNLKFEADSFKLSSEFLSKFNGKQTENFELFRELFLRGFIALKKNYPKIITILKSFSFRNDFKYNILYKVKNFEKRFNLHKNEKELIKYCLWLIEESVENWKTVQYDKYQLHASGIN